MYSRKILQLLLSIIPSGIAQGITVIAVPWYFTDSLNQSSTFSFWLGILTFLGLFWGLYAGVLIDKMNRKNILLNTNIVSSLIFLSVGISNVLFKVNNEFLIFLAFSCCSFYYMIFFPNLYALAQELTDRKNYVKINSIIEIQSQTISVVAALMCGILISGSQTFFNYFNIDLLLFKQWEIGEVFLLNSLLYLASYLILFPMHYQHKENIKKYYINNVIKEIKNSMLFLKKHKSILIYGICSQIIFAFLIVELFTLLPLFVKNCLNESLVIFSLADVTYCIGAIVSGIITMQILKKIHTIDFTILLIIITGYSFLLMIIIKKLLVFFIASFIIGITNASARITRMSYFFQRIPNHLIGRTNTIFNSINSVIRNVLIFIFSYSWFSNSMNVVFGYKLGIVVLIVFTIPLIIIQLKKL
ncbi:MAG: hypothetical protein CMD27_03910 [Flavobacteriales bacterium]|nr:hypothetical protein [Flavobacteriales bacterium]